MRGTLAFTRLFYNSCISKFGEILVFIKQRSEYTRLNKDSIVLPHL